MILTRQSDYTEFLRSKMIAAPERGIEIGTARINPLLKPHQAGHYATNEAHPMVKFSDELVAAVRSASGTYEAIAAHFGMSESHVGNIRRGDMRT